MKRIKLLFCFLISSIIGNSQNYVDTLYTIDNEFDIEYGTSVNFAGSTVTLEMDISYPNNAPSLGCGKPLALIIHGGAFAAGSKEDGNIIKLRKDFAKRGYVTATVNYRLGYFQTDVSKNCNIPNWNCINLADSSEWIRAWYRGVQDAKGALRYLIDNKDTYDIDPENVFVFGESAGAYISMGVAFLDDPSEKPTSCGLLSDVNPPHQDYYGPCISGSSYDIPIGNMDFSRPNLGDIDGDLNLSSANYIIRGVGSFYGGIFYDLFTENTYSEAPGLYLFHQPNDLIVPIGHNRLFKGFNDCAVLTGCVNIQDRSYSYGGMAINNMIDTLQVTIKPSVLFENSGNTANCLQQASTPSTGGHQFDSYWNRTSSMASLFSTLIDTSNCQTAQLTSNHLLNKVSVYPNPANDLITIESSLANVSYEMLNAYGRVLFTETELNGKNEIDVSDLPSGIYVFKFHSGDLVNYKRVVVQ